MVDTQKPIEHTLDAFYDLFTDAVEWNKTLEIFGSVKSPEAAAKRAMASKDHRDYEI